MWAESWPCVWQFPGYERVDRKEKKTEPKPKYKARIRANKNQTQAINKYISTAPYKSIWTLCWPNFIAFDTHTHTNEYMWSMALILAFISCSQQGKRKNRGWRRTWLHHPFSSGVFRGTNFNCNCRNPLPECRLGGDHVQRR